jgi:hypothetical protein
LAATVTGNSDWPLSVSGKPSVPPSATVPAPPMLTVGLVSLSSIATATESSPLAVGVA